MKAGRQVGKFMAAEDSYVLAKPVEEAGDVVFYPIAFVEVDLSRVYTHSQHPMSSDLQEGSIVLQVTCNER